MHSLFICEARRLPTTRSQDGGVFPCAPLLCERRAAPCVSGASMGHNSCMCNLS